MTVAGTRLRPSGRLKLLIALGGLLVLLGVVLQPVSVRTVDGSGIVRTSRCGLGYQVMGGPVPSVTNACRSAFSGRGVVASIVLAAMALLVALLVLDVSARRYQTEDEHESVRGAADELVDRSRGGTADVSGLDTLELPGDATGAWPALRRASSEMAFRGLLGMGAIPAVGLLLALRPVTVRTVDPGGVLRESACGLRYQLFGAPQGVVTDACRQAFAPRALAVALLLGMLGVIGGFLFHHVQYWRGLVLGAVWDGDRRRNRLLTLTGASAVSVVVIALAIAVSATSPLLPRFAPIRRPRVDASVIATTPGELASATKEFPESAGPFLAPQGMGARVRSTLGAGDVSPADNLSTGDRTALMEPAPEGPLQITATAWYAANPSIVDAMIFPAGSLPVGIVNGGDDKHAFFRVTGGAAVLELTESTSPLVTRSPETASMNVCAVTGPVWQPVEGGSLSSEPQVDRTRCALVQRSSTGIWRIDLSEFPDRGGALGFGLVPAAAAGTWQVTLSR